MSLFFAELDPSSVEIREPRKTRARRRRYQLTVHRQFERSASDLIGGEGAAFIACSTG